MFIYLSCLIVLCILANLVKNRLKLFFLFLTIFIITIFILIPFTHFNSMYMRGTLLMLIYFLLYPFLIFLLNIKVLSKITLIGSIPINIISIIFYIFCGICVFWIWLIFSIISLNEEYYFAKKPVSRVLFSIEGNDISGDVIQTSFFDENNKKVGFQKTIESSNTYYGQKAKIYYDENSICIYEYYDSSDDFLDSSSYDVNGLKEGVIEPGDTCNITSKEGEKIILDKTVTPGISLD